MMNEILLSLAIAVGSALIGGAVGFIGMTIYSRLVIEPRQRREFEAAMDDLRALQAYGKWLARKIDEIDEPDEAAQPFFYKPMMGPPSQVAPPAVVGDLLPGAGFEDYVVPAAEQVPADRIVIADPEGRAKIGTIAPGETVRVVIPFRKP